MSVDTAIQEGIYMCKGVLQRYFSYLQGVPVETFFPEGLCPTNPIGFTLNNREWFLKFDITDDPNYFFSFDGCEAKMLTKIMQKMVFSLKTMAPIIMEEIKKELVPRPELFMNSSIQFTERTSAFLSNSDETIRKELYEQFSKRIVFAWCSKE